MTRRGLILTAAALSGQTKKPATPNLKINLPGGRVMNTSQLVGSPFAVTIFKTTCPHCQKSLPIMEKIVKEFGPKGFKAVAVAVDQNAEPLVIEFAKTYKVSFPLGWAPIDDICRYIDLKPEQLYVPALMVMDRTGKVRGRFPGGDAFFNMEENNLRNLVELIVKDQKKS